MAIYFVVFFFIFNHSVIYIAALGQVVLRVDYCVLLYCLFTGGAESGFRHVTPDSYTHRLLHISGSKKNVEVIQEVTQLVEQSSDNRCVLAKCPRTCL